MKRYCTLLAAFFMASSCAQDKADQQGSTELRKIEFEGLWYYGEPLLMCRQPMGSHLSVMAAGP